MRVCNNLHNPQKLRCRAWVSEDCCILSLLLAVPSCIYSFWHGVIPTSHFIFNDFYSCFTNFLSLTVARGDMILPVRSTHYAYTYVCACVLWPRQKLCRLLAIKIKWRRSKRKSPRWTWILLSEGQTLPYYTKGTSCTKIRLSHVKIIVFRPLIWAVDHLY